MMERITEVPLMETQLTENYPGAGGKILRTIYLPKNLIFQNDSKHKSFHKYFNTILSWKSSSKTHMPLFSCHSTLILTQYWVSWGTPFKKSISSISLPFYYGVNCLTEGHIRFVGKFIEKQNSLQTETGLMHSLQPFTPCSVKKLQIPCPS